MGCWVETISDAGADGECRRIYDQVRSADGTVDPLYLAHGLRPATVAASDQLYKAVLHCCDNQLPKWLLELVATYSAVLLDCAYAAHHHGNNFRAAFADDRRADEIIGGSAQRRPLDRFRSKGPGLSQLCASPNLAAVRNHGEGYCGSARSRCQRRRNRRGQPGLRKLQLLRPRAERARGQALVDSIH